MQLYVIQRRNALGHRRRPQGRRRALDATEGDKPDSGVRWIRSYVVTETSGELGTFCIYEADSPEAIRAHAAASVMPADEIVPVADTVDRAARPRRGHGVGTHGAPAPAGGRAGRLQPVMPSSAFLASTSIPCSRARFSPRILRLAWSVSCG